MVKCVHVREIPWILLQITNVPMWTDKHPDLFVDRYHVSQPGLEEYIGTRYKDNRKRHKMFSRLKKAETVEIESHRERDVEYGRQEEDEAMRTIFRPYYEKMDWDPRLPLQKIFAKYASHLFNRHYESKGVLYCNIINFIRERGEQSIDDLLQALPLGSIVGDKRKSLVRLIQSASTGPLDFFVKTPDGNIDLTPQYK